MVRVGVISVSDDRKHLENALMLLKMAACPECDGSGMMPDYDTPDGETVAKQCQWHDEVQVIYDYLYSDIK